MPGLLPFPAILAPRGTAQVGAGPPHPGAEALRRPALGYHAAELGADVGAPDSELHYLQDNIRLSQVHTSPESSDLRLKHFYLAYIESGVISANRI